MRAKIDAGAAMDAENRFFLLGIEMYCTDYAGINAFAA
jgi:hypothetical protein